MLGWFLNANIVLGTKARRQFVFKMRKKKIGDRVFSFLGCFCTPSVVVQMFADNCSIVYDRQLFGYYHVMFRVSSSIVVQLKKILSFAKKIELNVV